MVSTDALSGGDLPQQSITAMTAPENPSRFSLQPPAQVKEYWSLRPGTKCRPRSTSGARRSGRDKPPNQMQLVFARLTARAPQNPRELFVLRRVLRITAESDLSPRHVLGSEKEAGKYQCHSRLIDKPAELEDISLATNLESKGVSRLVRVLARSDFLRAQDGRAHCFLGAPTFSDQLAQIERCSSRRPQRPGAKLRYRGR